MDMSMEVTGLAAGLAAFLAAFFPLMIAMIPYAIGLYFLAPRLGGNGALWVLLALIPFVNMFIFFPYVLFKVLFFIIDNMQRERAEPGL